MPIVLSGTGFTASHITTCSRSGKKSSMTAPTARVHWVIAAWSMIKRPCRGGFILHRSYTLIALVNSQEMLKMKTSWRCAVLMSLCMVVASVQAQKVPGNLRDDLKELVQTPAIPGYEQQLAALITARLQSYSPKTDNMGSILVTVGTGTPH